MLHPIKSHHHHFKTLRKLLQDLVVVVVLLAVVDLQVEGEAAEVGLLEELPAATINNQRRRKRRVNLLPLLRADNLPMAILRVVVAVEEERPRHLILTQTS